MLIVTIVDIIIIVVVIAAIIISRVLRSTQEGTSNVVGNRYNR